ncbi:MAG: branched-chain amino acid transport system permease protein livM, partial [Acidimicrobiaceae bacterium]
TAFLAGLFIGIVDQTIVFSTNTAGLSDPAVFVVVVVALLVQRGKLSRAMELGASSWQVVKEVRPIPLELRKLPEVRRTLTVLAVLVGLFVLGAPFILGDSQTPEATIMVIYAIIGVSLVVLTGWAGQISLGQYAIAGIGSATAAGLATNHHWDFFITIAAGALVGAAIAVAVGLPALRIQGLFLAVTTLAFAFAVQSLLNKDYFAWLLPKSGALANRPILLGSIDLEDSSDIGPLHLTKDAKYFYLCLVFLVLALAMARSLRRHRSGRVLIAVRDNGRVAQAFGVNLARSRLAAFAISGFIAGMAGALLAYQNRAFADNAFPPERSIEIFLLTVIGGIGSLPGAMLGALYVRGLPLLPGLRDIDQISLLTTGLGLLVLLLFLPGGLAEGMFKIRDGWLRRVASKRGVLVPSLVADTLVTDQAVPEPHLELPLADDNDVPVIACPACGELVPLADAGEHEHFAVSSNGHEPRELEVVDS